MIFNMLFSAIIWGIIGIAILQFLLVLGINPHNKIKPVPVYKGEM